MSTLTCPSGSIHYFVVEWDPATLAWSKFRGELLGPTDPASAPKDSIRGQIYSKWSDLGLATEPNTGDNGTRSFSFLKLSIIGVHASASPFEALAEKINWLEIKPEDDPFGAYLLASGLSADTLMAWTKDPVVPLDADNKGSLFDALEDSDVPQCAAKISDLAKL